MKEREIRERIEHFLRATARNVVVPASVGLGLGVAGCDSHAMQARAADAGRDSAVPVSDVAPASQPDGATAAPEVGDTAPTSDLPLMAVPYLMVLPPDDAAPDQTRNGESEAGGPGPDAAVDAYVPYPPLIYIYYMGRPSTDAAAAPKPAPVPSAPRSKA
jgi:hypothetical protein